MVLRSPIISSFNAVVALVLKPVGGKVAKSMLNYDKIDIQKILDIKLVGQFDKYLH